MSNSSHVIQKMAKRIDIAHSVKLSNPPINFPLLSFPPACGRQVKTGIQKWVNQKGYGFLLSQE